MSRASEFIGDRTWMQEKDRPNDTDFRNAIEIIKALQAENKRLKIDLESSAELNAELGRDYEKELKRLRDIIEQAGRGCVYVGSAYSGCPTSRKVEKLLVNALNEFKPLRAYLFEQKQALNPSKTNTGGQPTG